MYQLYYINTRDMDQEFWMAVFAEGCEDHVKTPFNTPICRSREACMQALWREYVLSDILPTDLETVRYQLFNEFLEEYVFEETNYEDDKDRELCMLMRRIIPRHLHTNEEFAQHLLSLEISEEEFNLLVDNFSCSANSNDVHFSYAIRQVHFQ